MFLKKHIIKNAIANYSITPKIMSEASVVYDSAEDVSVTHNPTLALDNYLGADHGFVFIISFKILLLYFMNFQQLLAKQFKIFKFPREY